MDSEGQDLLESALSSSFTAADVPRVSAAPASPTETTGAASEPPAATEGATPGGAPIDGADDFLAEQEAQLATWRAQNAEARERAERERARWEEIRAREGPPQGPLRGPHHHHDTDADGSSPAIPPAVPSSKSSAPLGSPSPADARDLVTGEQQGHSFSSAASSTVHVSRPASEHGGGDDSDFDSSLPSSLPSSVSIGHASSTHNSGANQKHTHFADEAGHASKAPIPAPPPYGTAAHAAASDRKHGSKGDGPDTITPMVFDGSLTTRSRTYALLASLGINLLLPFVNGLMLGFGEIFAKNYVSVWLGWSGAAASVAGVGLRSARK